MFTANPMLKEPFKGHLSLCGIVENRFRAIADCLVLVSTLSNLAQTSPSVALSLDPGNGISPAGFVRQLGQPLHCDPQEL